MGQDTSGIWRNECWTDLKDIYLPGNYKNEGILSKMKIMKQHGNFNFKEQLEE